MIAVIGDTDNVSSIKLHAAHGFAHVGTLKDVGFKHGRWLDVVVMQRPLGAAEDNSEPTGAPRRGGMTK